MNLRRIYTWLETAGADKSNNPLQKQMVIDLIQEELDELKKAAAEGNTHEEKNAVIDLLWVVTNYPYISGMSYEELEEHANLVEEENFSKFCQTEKEAQDTLLAYKTGTHPNKIGEEINCYYTVEGDYHVVRRIDGKVLKNINYKKLT